jgi:hypothetical protein
LNESIILRTHGRVPVGIKESSFVRTWDWGDRRGDKEVEEATGFNNPVLKTSADGTRNGLWPDASEEQEACSKVGREGDCGS